MNLTVLDPTTLKITLSPKEAERYCLSVQTEPIGSGELLPEHRTALRALLEEAGNRSGIDLVSRRILVRIYPMATGGCELYVSVVTEGEQVEGEEADSVCATASLKEALMLRLALHHGGFAGKTALYLRLDDEGAFLRVRGSHPPILGEFGQVLCISGARAEPWLTEHCRRLPDPEEGREIDSEAPNQSEEES